MDSNEPVLIKYEEIPLPDEPDVESNSETSTEEDSDGNPEKDTEDENDDVSMEEIGTTNSDEPGDENRAERIRAETIATILDSTFLPRKIKKDGRMYLVRLSREAASREEIVELSRTFEEVLKERQVRMKGYCPIRRQLYDFLFALMTEILDPESTKPCTGIPDAHTSTIGKYDTSSTVPPSLHRDELIRQSTINCAERGSMLLRVRDEFRMTMAAYERLYESGEEYGYRKALEAEMEQRKVEIQYKQLKEEVARSEQKIKGLQAEIDAEEVLSQERTDAMQARHEGKMEFLRQLNKQLTKQVSIVKKEE